VDNGEWHLYNPKLTFAKEKILFLGGNVAPGGNFCMYLKMIFQLIREIIA
jgi:hypothetical protein